MFPAAGRSAWAFFLFPFRCAHLGKEEKERVKKKKKKKESEFELSWIELNWIQRKRLWEARKSVGRIVYGAYFTAILGDRGRVNERRWTEKDILFILPPRSPPLQAPAMQLDLICEYAPVP